MFVNAENSINSLLIIGQLYRIELIIMAVTLSLIKLHVV